MKLSYTNKSIKLEDTCSEEKIELLKQYYDETQSPRYSCCSDEGFLVRLFLICKKMFSLYDLNSEGCSEYHDYAWSDRWLHLHRTYVHVLKTLHWAHVALCS